VSWFDFDEPEDDFATLLEECSGALDLVSDIVGDFTGGDADRRGAGRPSGLWGLRQRRGSSLRAARRHHDGVG
jgi:hypothetical protein